MARRDPGGHWLVLHWGVLRRLLLPLLLLLLLPACSPSSDDTLDLGLLTGDALVEQLRDGGLVLYLRHTETSSGGVDSISTLGACTEQRELTDAGREDAREIGAAFDALDLPVSRVVASPFCRTVETAELAFGGTDTDEGLLALASTGQESEQARADNEAAGRALIATVPPDGSNVVLVGHVSNVGPITGVSPAEGGTAVFRPDGEGSFTLVAEVPPQGWRELANRVLNVTSQEARS